jgi:hypothetical protein
MEKVRYDHADKILYQVQLPCGLRMIIAPMPLATKTIIGAYVGVGGYARTYSIGGQKIFPGTADMVALALSKFHPESANPLFNDKDVSFKADVEESYTSFKVICPSDKAVSFIAPLVSLLNHFEVTNDEAESLKKDYMAYQESRLSEEVEPFRSALYSQSPMKEHPFGTPDSVKNVHLVAMKRFYQEFYTPEQITLFAVGNIDPLQIDAEAKKVSYDSHTDMGPIDIKPYKEDYLKVADPNAKCAKEGRLVLLSKFAPRQTLVEKHGEVVFSYYELLPFVLLSPSNKLSAPANSLIKSINTYGVRQGGEDAFFYLDMATDKPEELKAELEKLIAVPKIVTYFNFHKVKKDFLATVRGIYKNDLEGYFNRLCEALANSYADPEITESAYKASSFKFRKFFADFASFPRLYIC